MRAGKLDKLVSLLEPIADDDNMGGRGVEEWQPVAKVWADFLKPRVATIGTDGGIASVQTQEIRIRWRSDVAPGWRLQYGKEVRDIEHVFSTNRRETILITRIADYMAPSA